MFTSDDCRPIFLSAGTGSGISTFLAEGRELTAEGDEKGRPVRLLSSIWYLSAPVNGDSREHTTAVETAE